jgi:heme A synthase
LVLVIWISAAEKLAYLKRFGWFTLAVFAASAAVGLRPVLGSAPSSGGIAHACLAQILFAMLAAVAMFTSSAWKSGAQPVADHGWPSLRSLAILTPALVLIQIGLGAAFRHKALGVLPHISGALLVMLVILMVCVFVMQQFPEHRPLRSAAVALLVVTAVQIFLGIGAFTARMVTTQNTPAVVASIGAHVVTGALTLAASLVLAIQIRRNVYKPVEEE